MPHLVHQSFLKLYATAGAILGSGYTETQRKIYFAAVPPGFLGRLAVNSVPTYQLFSDLQAMNERMVPFEGVIPLEVWLRNLTALHSTHPQTAQLQAFLDQIKTPVPAAPDALPDPAPIVVGGAPANGESGTELPDLVFEACCDAARLPLLNRHALRSSLRDLVEGNFRALSVLGEPLSGKTYSLQFIHHVAKASGRLVHTLDVRSQDLDAYGPGDLAEDLVEVLETAAVPPEKRSQTARWIKQLRNWTVEQFKTRLNDFWIVLDHFDDETVEEPTKRLIQQLIQRSEVGRLPPIILLGYERPDEPERLERTIHREEIGAIGKDEVERHYRSLLADNGSQPDPEAVEAAVEAVYNQLGGDPEVGDLSRAVQAVDEALLA